MVGDGSAKVFKKFHFVKKKVPPLRAGVTLCNGYITVVYQTELMMPASRAVHMSCAAGGEEGVKSFSDSSKLVWK